MKFQIKNKKIKIFKIIYNKKIKIFKKINKKINKSLQLNKNHIIKIKKIKLTKAT